MITANSLFIKRLSAEWRNNLSALKLIADWTVIVYIIIPFVCLGIYQYVIWWRTPPEGLALIPFDFFMLINAIFAWWGTIRLFIKRADQLFLWSRKNWMKAVVSRGIFYSLFLNFFLTLLLFLLLAPFYVGHYTLSLNTLTNLFLITLLSKMTAGLLKQFIQLSFTGIKHFFVQQGTFAVFILLFVWSASYLPAGPLSGFVSVIILLVTAGYLVNKRINTEGSFFDDLEREQNESLKYVNLVFNISGISGQKQSKRTRPLLFRRSNLLFKKRTAVNGLAELCLKSSLRNSKHLFFYIQLVIICVLIVVTVSYLKWLVWLGIALFLTVFVSLFWMTPVNSDFVKALKWKEKDKYHASQKFLFIMTLPGFVLISFAVGYQAFSWPGGLAVISAGVIVVYYASKLVSLLIYNKAKSYQSN